MKVKVKLSVDQFKYLVQYIERSVKYFEIGELTAINIRLFVSAGFKKLIDLQTDLLFNPYKVKTFAIEINQYVAIIDTLANDRDKMDSYTLSIYTTLQSQNKHVLGLKN